MSALFFVLKALCGLACIGAVVLVGFGVIAELISLINAFTKDRK